jgi:hypothetical protein
VNQGNSAGTQDDQPQEAVPDRTFQSWMEWAKILYDFYKNFMTVALASIAAAAAFAGGVFKHTFNPNAPVVPKLLVAVSVGAFIVTLLMSIQGMHLARRHALRLHKHKTELEFEQEREKSHRELVWQVVQLSYVVGIIALIIYLVIEVLS